MLMQRRLILAGIASALTGCQPAEKRLQVMAPPIVPASKIERVLIWLPPETGLVSADTGKMFVAALSSYGVTAEVGRSTALELNRGEDQAPLMNELKATHRLEIEVASYSQIRNYSAEWTLAILLYAGTGRTPLMRLRYRPDSFYDKMFAGVVVQKMREYGYL
jgi:hypothetical protein